MQAVMELQLILVAEDVRPSVMRPVPELIMECVTTSTTDNRSYSIPDGFRLTLQRGVARE